jgi:hypothetical protein
MRPFDTPETARILAFLGEIGVPVEITPLPDTTFLPGIDVVRGRLLVDPDRLGWPGDLLHDAGHIAVSDPATRASAESVSSDPGEEMAAIAWSYAAACAIGIDSRIVFHEAGYKGGGGYLADNFERGDTVGVPMLAWFGMADERGPEAFPAMRRWLR